MALCKPGFIIDRYGWKSELLDSFSASLLYRISSDFAKRFVGSVGMSIYGPWIGNMVYKYYGEGVEGMGRNNVLPTSKYCGV
jgi:hypothetical protein